MREHDDLVTAVALTCCAARLGAPGAATIILKVRKFRLACRRSKRLGSATSIEYENRDRRLWHN